MNARALAARHEKLAAAAQGTTDPKAASGAKSAEAADSNSFLDTVLDIVNPLQHVPLVSTAYRAITGDKIGDVARIAGDTLYGGLAGLGSAVANIAFREITGKDFGDTALALLGIDDAQTTPTAVAQAKPASTTLASAPTAPAAAKGGIVDLTSAQSAALSAQIAAMTPAAAAMPQGKATPGAQAPDTGDRREPKPAAVVPAQATNMLADPAAFMASLKARGIDPNLAMRAMTAYQKTLGLGDKAAAVQP